MPVTLAGTCGLQAELRLVQEKTKPLCPKPHRNQLLEGWRPTLELNIDLVFPALRCLKDCLYYTFVLLNYFSGKKKVLNIIITCDNFCLDFCLLITPSIRIQIYFLSLIGIQFEIKCKMTADVWAISPYVYIIDGNIVTRKKNLGRLLYNSSYELRTVLKNGNSTNRFGIYPQRAP